MDAAGILVIGLILVGVIVALFAIAPRVDARREALAAALHGQVIPGGVRGTYEGVTVTVVFTSTGRRNHATTWTYVESPLPGHYPFTLYLRGHVAEDARELERGEMVDVEVGDPAFDRVFLVEGAPAEVVRHVLTPRVRELLGQRPPLRIDTVNGQLQLLVGGWHEDASAVAPWVEVVATIAGGVRSAHAAADEAVPLAADGGAYRAIPDDRPLQEARAGRAAEVARLGSARRAREVEYRNVAILSIVIVSGLAAVGLLLAGSC